MQARPSSNHCSYHMVFLVPFYLLLFAMLSDFTAFSWCALIRPYCDCRVYLLIFLGDITVIT